MFARDHKQTLGVQNNQQTDMQRRSRVGARRVKRRKWNWFEHTL